MAIEAPIKADRYIGESEVRGELASAVWDSGFIVEQYALKDANSKRSIAFTLASEEGDEKPTVFKQIALTLAQYGYGVDSLKITGTASKFLTDPNQAEFPLS